jgi:hypothetical protein
MTEEGLPKGTRKRFKKGDVFIATDTTPKPSDLVGPLIQMVIGNPKYTEYTKGVPRWDCDVIWLTEGKYKFKRNKFYFHDDDIQLDSITLLGETPETKEPITQWEMIFTTNTTSGLYSFPIGYTTATTSYAATNWIITKGKKTK